MRIFTLPFLFLSGGLLAQSTIQSADLPNANDVLVTRVANLLTTVDLEETGPNHTWNYGYDILQPQNLTNTTNCVDVAATPLVYQVFFNNPFDPVHNSDFAIGVGQIDATVVTLEDVYTYFQNSNTKYVQTGAGASINGVPTGAQGDPVDIIYHLPIEYGDEDYGDSQLLYSIPTIGAYQLTQNRHNFCSGWGTLNIWDQTFPVLMMRTELVASDSMYIDFIGQGIAFDRPLAVEYKWLCPAFNVPVLQINTSGGVITSVQTADIYTGVSEKSTFTFSIYPNPSSDIIKVGGMHAGEKYSIFDQQGRLVKKDVFLGSGEVTIEELSAGSYYLTAERDGQVISKMFVKQ